MAVAEYSAYGSWEYSQGPALFIDSSGFESIDDNKNFVYYYIVTYSPVEYKRKVTDTNGNSFYEYRYSFGTNFSERKVLGTYTFSGKNKLTKTVTHSVTEDGFTKSISKIFVIDTNINSNLNTNTQVQIDPSVKSESYSWIFRPSESVTLPSSFAGVQCGWLTVQKTGYKTEYYTVQVTHYSSYSYWSNTGVGWSGNVPTQGTYKVQNGYLYQKHYGSSSYTTYETRSRTVSYQYNQLYQSRGAINLNDIKNKISDRKEYTIVKFVIRSRTGLSEPPKLSISYKTDETERQYLYCYNSGTVYANTDIVYYIPHDWIYNTSNSQAYIYIDKETVSQDQASFSQAYAMIETYVDLVPYVNLVIQAYTRERGWFDCCSIPYLNYVEIRNLREGSTKKMSKNLFMPSNLPNTGYDYRVFLDTNLRMNDPIPAKLSNFRIDVLANQLIPAGSIIDKALYLSNDSLEFDNEVEVSRVDELKLNVLESINYEKKTPPGFLKKGANEVHSYLKDSVNTTIDVNPENKTKNIFYDCITKMNGNWISNSVFVANTFTLPYIGPLQGQDTSLEDDLIEFKVPCNILKSYSSYTLTFDTFVEDSLFFNGDNEFSGHPGSDLTCVKLYSSLTFTSCIRSSYSINQVYYSPSYHYFSNGTRYYNNETNMTGKDVRVEMKFSTNYVSPTNKDFIVIKIKRSAMKNITIKDMHMICTDSNGVKYIDVFEPYNVDINSSRQLDTFMTIYYDGFNIKHINPFLYKDMVYLRRSLDKIRSEYELAPYPWSKWTDESLDLEGHKKKVYTDLPIRADHFNDVKNCCVQTYEDLLSLNPPVSMNNTPSFFRDNTGLILLNDYEPQGYVLQHYFDKDGNEMNLNEFFPEWKKIIDLINRN